MTMNKNLIFALLAISALWSCGNLNNSNNGSTAVNEQGSSDTTLCQFSNIDMDKQFSYIDDDGDTLYFSNSFSAFWPQIINGKPCPNLQQALSICRLKRAAAVRDTGEWKARVRRAVSMPKGRQAASTPAARRRGFGQSTRSSMASLPMPALPP